MEKYPYDYSDPVPIYILFVFAVLLCAYFAWLGSVAVRLYSYKGALAPEPKRSVILPAYLRDRSPQCSHNRRVTAFSIPMPPKSSAHELAQISQFTRVNVANVNENDLLDPEIRTFFAEQQRISRLTAFVQDDCGDGSDFPDVPFAITPVETKQQTLAPPALERTLTAKYGSVSLKMLTQNEWLTIDNTYTKMHKVRDYLLTKKNVECIQVKRDGENACEELLRKVQH